MKGLVPMLALMSVAASAQAHDGELIGLSRAIEAAERYLSARAIEGELETRSSHLVYEIDLVRGEALHRALVDAHDGRLLSAERPRVENIIRSWVDADRIRAGGRAHALAEQLQGLEQRTGGEVKSVLFRLRDRVGVYVIELATAAGVGKVHIDAATGRRLVLKLED